MSEESKESFIKEDFKNMSTEVLVKHLSQITEVNLKLIDTCNYSKEELVDVFERAVHYFNEIAEGHKKLKALPSSYEVYLPGGKYSSSYDGEFFEHAVEAARINAKVIGYEQSLTRLANSITADAIVQATRTPR